MNSGLAGNGFCYPITPRAFDKLNLLFRDANTWKAFVDVALHHVDCAPVSLEQELGDWWRASRHDWPALARTQGTSRLA
jgi:hypothetical protein